MRTPSPLLLAALACAWAVPAHAAVTCVLNKDTKTFESSVAKPGQGKDGTAEPCDPAAAKQTLEGVQQAINTAGSKLVNVSVIVNMDKLPIPAGAKPAAPMRAASRVEETPAELALPGTPIKPVAAIPAKPRKPNDRTKRDWVLRTTYQTLEEALDDFASQVDYEVVYEAREFPLGLQRDIPLAHDVDFWEALRLLGEAYRKSDGAFQILPTKFKQIVVLPAGQQNPANGAK